MTDPCCPTPDPALEVSEIAIKTPKHDNFYTPQNEEFYKTFKYHDLNRENKEIRLIRLLSPGSDGQIVCELVDNIPLAQYRNQYTALSYCAGDPKKTEAILINGHSFNVFANLGHALREVQSFWTKTSSQQNRTADRLKFWVKNVLLRKRLLWVDQICINQSNTAERSHQVSNDMSSLVCFTDQIGR